MTTKPKALPTTRGAVIRMLADYPEASIKSGDLLRLKKNMITVNGQSDVWETSTRCWLLPESIAQQEFEVVAD